MRRSAPLPRVAMKRTPRKRASASEKRHYSRVAALGCLVCGAQATIHHVTSDGNQRIARSNKRVVPLCAPHHQIQHGPQGSVEALGHAGFTNVYGIDLLEEADRLWAESDALERGKVAA